VKWKPKRFSAVEGAEVAFAEGGLPGNGRLEGGHTGARRNDSPAIHSG